MPSGDDDVYAWLEKRTEDAETRAVMLLAARKLYNAGFSLREIGTALGVSHDWVHRSLKEQDGITNL